MQVDSVNFNDMYLSIFPTFLNEKYPDPSPDL